MKEEENQNGNGYENAFSVYEGTIGLYSANDNLKAAIQQQYPILSIVLLFCSAYLVAALVEESCKYFGFKMVEHPDFVSEKDLQKAVALGVFDEDDDNEEDRFECGGGFECGDADDDYDGDTGELEHPSRQVITSRFIDDNVQDNKATSEQLLQSRKPKPDVYKCPEKSLSSTGAAITIAMVSVSLGFACCENLMYIFLYTGGSIYSEVGVLITRSLFPVHPLCAGKFNASIIDSFIKVSSSNQFGCIFQQYKALEFVSTSLKMTRILAWGVYCFLLFCYMDLTISP